MDREAPKRRPQDKKPAGFHSWRTLSFLHWEVPAELLQRLVHPRLTIDTFEGRAFIGLVPFTMKDIRLFPLPRWPGMTNFHETNVRTYVHLDGRDPGVWFFSLDAASRQCVLGARVAYHLPYHFADMRLEAADERVRYRSDRAWPKPTPAHCEVAIEFGPPLGAATPGSLEDFLAERYFLYSAKGDRLYRGQVHHTPYPLRAAKLERVDQTLLSSAGVPVSGPPVSVLASDGVDVDVYAIEAV
ncbi:MAG: DUF2071 domain-containing protein [Polyangiaceae bacterium]